MECITFDTLSLPVETSQGNTCVLVACGYFTKRVETFALSDHKAPINANVLFIEVFFNFVSSYSLIPIKYKNSCQNSWQIYTSYLRSSACTLVHIDHNPTA